MNWATKFLLSTEISPDGKIVRKGAATMTDHEQPSTQDTNASSILEDFSRIAEYGRMFEAGRPFNPDKVRQLGNDIANAIDAYQDGNQ